MMRPVREDKLLVEVWAQASRQSVGSAQERLCRGSGWVDHNRRQESGRGRGKPEGSEGGTGPQAEVLVIHPEGRARAVNMDKRSHLCGEKTLCL